MAIAVADVGTTAKAAGSNPTITGLVSSGSDRLLVVGINFDRPNTGVVVNSVAWDPAGDNQALTEAISVHNGTDVSSSSWYLVAPSEKTSSAAVTFSDPTNCDIVANGIIFTGVHQGTPFNRAGSNTRSDATCDLRIISDSDSMVYTTGAFNITPEPTVNEVSPTVEQWIDFQDPCKAFGGTAPGDGLEIRMRWGTSVPGGPSASTGFNVLPAPVPITGSVSLSADVTLEALGSEFLYGEASLTSSLTMSIFGTLGGATNIRGISTLQANGTKESGTSVTFTASLSLTARTPLWEEEGGKEDIWTFEGDGPFTREGAASFILQSTFRPTGNRITAFPVTVEAAVEMQATFNISPTGFVELGSGAATKTGTVAMTASGTLVPTGTEIEPVGDIPGDFFVGPNGSDSTGDGSQTNPWGTIAFGARQLASGQTLVVLDGTYDNGTAHIINQDSHVNGPGAIASGTPTARTTVRAQTPFGVRIKDSSGLSYWQAMLWITGDYIRIDGFIFDSANYSGEHTLQISGDHNYISRCIVKRSGSVNRFGGWLRMGGSFNLVEDCAGVGACRYGFLTAGPSSNARYNIFRRCVGRYDYSDSDQPKSCMAQYGNNGATSNSDANGNYITLTHHIIWQNCIVINARQPARLGDFGYIQPFTTLKKSQYASYQGCIALDCEAEYGGFYIDDNDSAAPTHTWQNCVSWDIRQGPYGSTNPAGVWDRNGNGGSLAVHDHNTVGEVETGTFSRLSTVTKGATELFDPVGLTELVSPDGSGNGATILKKIGRTGAFYGDTGWDEVTAEDLWPFPNEAAIKSVFSESNDPPAGATPPTNDTTRGFCRALDAFGNTMTLSRYIRQYLGTEWVP